MMKLSRLEAPRYDSSTDWQESGTRTVRIGRTIMTSIQISELASLADKLRRGETIEILDGENCIATIVPRSSSERKLRKKPAVPAWFLAEAPPQFPASVLDQLLHDRRSRDW